jgi:AraC-like DNA-binding protein
MRARSIEEWREVASSAFVPIDCRTDGIEFRGAIEHLRVGGIALSDIRSDATTIDRPRRLITSSSSDDVHISFQLASTGRVTQDGRAVHVSQGAATLYRLDRPYRLAYTEGGQRQVVVRLPRVTMSGSGMGQVGPLELQGTAAGRALLSLSLSMLSNSGRLPAASRQPTVVLALAQAMLRSSESAGVVLPSDPGALIVIVLDHIRRFSSSPDLTVESVARAHHLSRRKLYQLFELLGTGPSEYIRDTRLLAASSLLSAGDRAPVAAIAGAAGFADNTTFTRAFIRQYGCTPTQWRARELHAREDQVPSGETARHTSLS